MRNKLLDIKALRLILWGLIALLTCSCKPKVNNDDNGNDVPAVIDSNTVRITLSQSGDVLFDLSIFEGEYDIDLSNALHIDSIRSDIVTFYMKNRGDNFSSVDPYVFIFAQSIDSTIDYYDFCIAQPGGFPSVQPDYFDAIKDSVFYIELFCCLFSVNDIAASGSDSLMIWMQNGETLEEEYMSRLIDASRNTVSLDNALIRKDIVVDTLVPVLYSFTGGYDNRARSIFMLTRYPRYGYDLNFSGVFWENTSPYMMHDMVDIYVFWPILNSRYHNYFGNNSAYDRRMF